MMVVTYYSRVKSVRSRAVQRTYLSFVASGHTGGKDLVFDATGGQMIEHCMIRHIQHTAIVLHGSRSIKY